MNRSRSAVALGAALLLPALSGTSAASLVDPTSLTKPDAGRPGYELVFSDEFEGDSLDPARWNGSLRWDGDWNGERFEYRRINGEHQFYVNPLSDDQEMLAGVLPAHDPFQFDGERLAIRAVKNPLRDAPRTANHGELETMVSQQHFLSGAMSTHDKFSQKYGYFEARIKLPGTEGTFPAFWLYHQRSRAQGTQRTEIDIMENLGHFPEYVYNSAHYNTGVAVGRSGTHNFLKPEPSGQVYTGTDYSAGYHTYAVEWEPGKVTWLIDDQVVSELREPQLDHEELYLIVNLAMGGNWTNFARSAGGLGRPDDEHFPNANDLATFSNPALEIDWVRVYKRP